jgi:glycosyltransferase involved in cell wall biosynthesis
MRILHVVTAFPRSPDDVIVPWLVELLKGLQAKGHEVEVLTSAYRGGGNATFDGIPVHRFRYFPAPWEDLTHDEAVPDRLRRAARYRLAAVCYVAAGMVAAWRLSRRRRYDVVHVHWAMPHALLGWAARAASGARLVTTFYGVELRWTASALGPLRWIVARAARTSDAAVAISRHTAEEVRRLAGIEAEVIPYGAAGGAGGAGGTGGTGGTGGAEGAVRAARAASAPAAPPAPPVPPFTVLFVGRLVERKGVHVLLDAAARLAPRRPLRVVIIGDGPERQRLEAHAARQGLAQVAQFRGRISAAELARAYASAQACVLPAVVDARGDTEGLGVVLLEAMSYRVPVVGSEIGGITDILADGDTGLLVTPGDPEALGAALERLAADPALARRLGEAGYRAVRERFSWTAIVERWERVYRAVVSSGASSPAPAAPPRG